MGSILSKRNTDELKLVQGPPLPTQVWATMKSACAIRPNFTRITDEKEERRRGGGK